MTQSGKSGQVQEGLKIYINLPQVSSLPNHGKLLERCFIQGRNVYKKAVEESGLSRQRAHFLRKLYKLVLKYSQLAFCTVPLRYVRSNFKIIEEICERDEERWK